MINQFESCANCWVQKYLLGWPFPYYKPFDEGRKYHEEVHKYHTLQKFNWKLIRPYTSIYPENYRKQSEVKFKKILQYQGWKFPLPAVGIIDGIRDQELVDLKYAKSKPKTNRNLQSILYSFVYYMDKGKFPIFTFNWVNKTNDKVKNVSVTHTIEDIEWLTKKLDTFLKDIQLPVTILKEYPARPFMNIHYPDCPHDRSI